MDPSQTIRVAKNFDTNYIFGIERSVFGSTCWSCEKLANCLHNKSTITFILEKSKEIIGYNIVTFVEREFEIIRLAVAHKYQSKGFGNALLSFLLDQIPNNSSVFLDVKKSNTSGINPYKKNGFDIINIRYNYYQDGSDTLIMYFKN